MNTLTPGKIRGLQQISTSGGLFAICAMDHRGSMAEMLNRVRPGSGTYDEIVRRKQEFCSILSPHATGVLLDPEYGAAQCLAAGALPGDRGLLVSAETSGYSGSSDARLTTLLEEWGVDKIKRLGASAVKLLLYYRPELGDVAARQIAVLNRLATDCSAHDIPLLVEAVSYRIAGETAEQLAAKRAVIATETARQVTASGADVLKAEFPAAGKGGASDTELLERCRRLSQASRLPWVVLSGGVDYGTFLKQVEIACRGGASGFLGGRAIWQEAVAMENEKERVKFLSTTVVDRVRRLVEVTVKYGTPWYHKLGLEAGKLTVVKEGWYKGY
jgi:tagatose-1,6-bisphosphate aldolase